MTILSPGEDVKELLHTGARSLRRYSHFGRKFKKKFKYYSDNTSWLLRFKDGGGREKAG